MTEVKCHNNYLRTLEYFIIGEKIVLLTGSDEDDVEFSGITFKLW